MAEKINCLEDCNAWCCWGRTIAFDFTLEEVLMMEANGAILTFMPGKGYFFENDCPFLKGRICILHGKKAQPGCCKMNKVGEKFCLKVRRRVFDRLKEDN